MCACVCLCVLEVKVNNSPKEIQNLMHCFVFRRIRREFAQKENVSVYLVSEQKTRALLTSAGIVFTSHKLSKSLCAGNPVSVSFDLCAGTAFKQDV